MKKQLTNPYWAALFGPLVLFLVLVHFRVDPDTINLWARVYAFILMGYVAARYVGRAPVLIWRKNTAPEARNIVGWAVLCVGFMFQIGYGWVYIAYDRPEWLSSQYWGGSFVVLIALGLTIVATSVRRFPPFGDGGGGLSELASVAVVIGSALAVFGASHLPQVVAAIKSAFVGFAHAL